MSSNSSSVPHISLSPLLGGQWGHNANTEGPFIQFVYRDTIMSDITERAVNMLWICRVGLPSAGASELAAGAASSAAGAAAAVIEC